MLVSHSRSRVRGQLGLLGLLVSVLLPAASLAQQIQANFRVTSDWKTGFTGEIELINKGATPISGWTLEFDLGGQIVNLWNARVTASGTHYTVRDLGWNGGVRSGGSVVFGFQASYSGDRPGPTNCRFNGQACSFGGAVPSPGPSAPVAVPAGIRVEWRSIRTSSTTYGGLIRIVNQTNAAWPDWQLKFDLAGSIQSVQGATVSSSNNLRTASTSDPSKTSIPRRRIRRVSVERDLPGYGARAHVLPLERPGLCLLEPHAAGTSTAGTRSAAAAASAA